MVLPLGAHRVGFLQGRAIFPLSHLNYVVERVMHVIQQLISALYSEISFRQLEIRECFRS